MIDVTKQDNNSLKNMIKALSMFEILNSEEENQRLKAAKQELNKRKRK